MKKTYYIYRYLNKEKEVIYVGLTSRPVEKRIKEHEIESLQNETFCIEYAEVATKADMQQYEIFYINKYQPRFNIRSLDEEGTTLALPELTFKPFKKKNEKTEIYIHPNHDKREYSLKFNHGLIEVNVLNPYARMDADKKIEVNIKGELILNKEESKKMLEMFVMAANDLTDDNYLELTISK